MVHGKARVLPVDEAGGQMGGDELFLQKKPDHHTTEVLRHSMDVAEGHVDKLAPLIEPPLQHEAVVIRIPPQELAAGLVRQDHCRPDGSFGCFGVEPLKDGKDEPADLRE